MICNLVMAIFILDTPYLQRHVLFMTTNNHILLASLYANPLAAGATAADLEVEAAYDFPAVQSMPTIPPRACAAFAPVASLPHVPPRA